MATEKIDQTLCRDVERGDDGAAMNGDKNSGYGQGRATRFSDIDVIEEQSDSLASAEDEFYDRGLNDIRNGHPPPTQNGSSPSLDDSRHRGSFRLSVIQRAKEGAAALFKGKAARPLNQRSLREMKFVVCAGLCLSFNSGYINGCCLSGLLSPSGSIVQAVSAFTGTYTKSGLALAGGDAPLFGFEFSMILSFIAGSFLSALINPKAIPHQLGPTYGPTFIVGSVLLFVSSILSSIHPDGKALFFFAAAANGLQNGMTSMYSGNLIRTTHLTGTSTDIGLFLGQLARGNKANQWKCFILIGLAAAFWLGSFTSLYAARRFRSFSLLFNACFFLFIGFCSCVFVVLTQHITIWQAATGDWQWDVALDNLDIDKSKYKDGTLDESVMEIFDNIDADNDGFIEENELYVALKATGMHVTEKSVKSMLMVADENGDGLISRDEFRSLLHRKASKKSLAKRVSRSISRKMSVASSNVSDTDT